MKYLVCIILLLIILGLYTKNMNEGFADYDLDYGTGIGPWWAQGAGLNRGFHRCVCSGSGNCQCINDNELLNTSIYPQYYFN